MSNGFSGVPGGPASAAGESENGRALGGVIVRKLNFVNRYGVIAYEVVSGGMGVAVWGLQLCLAVKLCAKPD
jgi:hypothetical protein